MQIRNYGACVVLGIIMSLILTGCSGGAGFASLGGLVGDRSDESESNIQDAEENFSENDEFNADPKVAEVGTEKEDGELESDSGSNLGVVVPKETTGFRLLSSVCRSSGEDAKSIKGMTTCKLLPGLDTKGKTIFRPSDQLASFKNIKFSGEHQSENDQATGATSLKLLSGKKITIESSEIIFDQDSHEFSFLFPEAIKNENVAKVEISVEVNRYDRCGDLKKVRLKFKKVIIANSSEAYSDISTLYTNKWESVEKFIPGSWFDNEGWAESNSDSNSNDDLGLVMRSKKQLSAVEKYLKSKKGSGYGYDNWKCKKKSKKDE